MEGETELGRGRTLTKVQLLLVFLRGIEENI